MTILFFSSRAFSTRYLAVSASCCATCFASTADAYCGLNAKCVCQEIQHQRQHTGAACDRRQNSCTQNRTLSVPSSGTPAGKGGAEPMIRHRSPCKNPLRVSAVHSALVVKPARGHGGVGYQGACKWSQYVPSCMHRPRRHRPHHASARNHRTLCRYASHSASLDNTRRAEHECPEQALWSSHWGICNALARAACWATSKLTQVSVMTRQERWQMAVILRFG